MTIQTIPDAGRSDTTPVTTGTQPGPQPSPWPGPYPPSPPTSAPRVAAVGNAEVTFLPDGGRLAVTLDVGAHMVVTNEQAARDLYACLRRVFDPLGETQDAAREHAKALDVKVAVQPASSAVAA